MSSLGDRLRQLRVRKGLSQLEFADMIGINPRTQGNYESGKRIPDAIYLEQLSQFNVDLNDLVMGTNVTSIDEGYLQTAIRELEKTIDEVDGYLEPEHKAKLIVFLYEELISGETISINKIARHLKLVS